MEAEAAPLVKRLELKLDSPPVIAPPAPCVSYSGQEYGATIHLVCFGACASGAGCTGPLCFTFPCAVGKPAGPLEGLAPQQPAQRSPHTLLSYPSSSAC